MNPVIYETEFYEVVAGDGEYNYCLVNKETRLTEFEHNLLPIVIKTAEEASNSLERYYHESDSQQA